MKICRFLSFLLLCTFVAGSVHGRDVVRHVTKTFDAIGGMELIVDNRYGNIVVRTWESNEISFSVEIKGKARKEDMAQKMADRVRINFTRNPSSVSARTVIAEKKENCSDCGVEINYTIQVPRYVRLNLSNKYGNILLDQIDQPFRGDIRYGDLRVERLGGRSNRVECHYGNVYVMQATTLALSAAHSDVTVDKAASLTVTTSYSGVRVGETDYMTMNSKYDNYHVKRVGQLFADAPKYTQFRVEQLEQSLSVTGMSYGSIKILKVSPEFARIQVNATYSDIQIGLSTRQVVQLDITNRYGQINMDKRFNTSRLNAPRDLSKERDLEYVVGILGEGNTVRGEVLIKNTHGKIRVGEVKN